MASALHPVQPPVELTVEKISATDTRGIWTASIGPIQMYGIEIKAPPPATAGGVVWTFTPTANAPVHLSTNTAPTDLKVDGGPRATVGEEMDSYNYSSFVSLFKSPVGSGAALSVVPDPSTLAVPHTILFGMSAQEFPVLIFPLSDGTGRRIYARCVSKDNTVVCIGKTCDHVTDLGPLPAGAVVKRSTSNYLFPASAQPWSESSCLNAETTQLLFTLFFDDDPFTGTWEPSLLVVLNRTPTAAGTKPGQCYLTYTTSSTTSSLYLFSSQFASNTKSATVRYTLQ